MKVFISVNLFRTVKLVAKRSYLCLKMRLVEELIEVWKVFFTKKESFNGRFNKKRIKYPIHYQTPCIYLTCITDTEKLKKKLTVS